MALRARWWQLLCGIAIGSAACQLVDPASDLTSGGPLASADQDASAGVADAADAGPLADAPGEAEATPDAGGCDADLSSDEGNCGRCGRRCSGGCEAGMCNATEAFPGSVSAMTCAGGRVYWSETGTSASVHAYDPVTGANVKIASNVDAPGAIAVSPPYVVFAAGDGRVHEVLTDGGSAITLANAGGFVSTVAASSTTAFYQDPANTPRSVPLGGGDGGVVTEATLAMNLSPGLQATDSVLVYMQSGGQLVQYGLVSGSVTVTIPQAGGSVAGIALGPSDVYFNAGAQVYDVTLGQAGAREIGQTFPLGDGGLNPVNSITADDAGVIWVGVEGAVLSCADPACAGGALALGVVPNNFPTFLCGSPTDVFFYLPSQGAVWTLPR